MWPQALGRIRAAGTISNTSESGRFMRSKIAAVLLALVSGAALLVYGRAGWFGGSAFVTAPVGPARTGEVPAVVLSGDMGFDFGLSGSVVSRLQRDGVPVVAVNSLAYWSIRRTPEEASALLSEAIRRALARSTGGKVDLIGQSFGADMLHSGLAGLATDLRSHVRSVVLVVPGDTVIHQASPAELLNLVSGDGPALETANKLDWAPVTCIRGAEETDSLCPLLHMPNVREVVLPGGHLLRFDADRLYLAVREGMAPAKPIPAFAINQSSNQGKAP